MAISKPGMASFLIGLLVIAASWYFWFQAAGFWAMIVAVLQGGIILFGLFMALIGILMLVI